METGEIRPITMPDVHARFLEYFRSVVDPSRQSVLDLGAGEGALTQKLYEMGFSVHACDLHPEYFKFNKVKCSKVDIALPFPYPEACFDLVIAVEVTEHILDHENFFREINRILKPEGRLFISTPNILSMKSRIRFFCRGFPYAFKPLEKNNFRGLQHVSSLSLDQYNYIAVKHNFNMAEYDVDRFQSSSRWLLALFFAFIWLNQKIRGFEPVHNQKKLLMGRLLFMIFQKSPVLKDASGPAADRAKE